MRVLVTGGTGFIGTYLVSALRRRGDTVLCLLRRPVLWSDPGIECITVDLTDSAMLRRVLDGVAACEDVFHFGAMLPLPSHSGAAALSPYLPTNVDATAILLEKAAAWNAGSFVFASSLPIIGKPVSIPVTEDHPVMPEHPYLQSKYLAEISCEFFNRKKWLSVSSLRISSPYGPGMNPGTVLSLFMRLARESRDIQLFGTGARKQNFVHVSDVVQAALLAAEPGRCGIYNVAGRRATSMRELAEAVIAVAPGSTSQVKFSGQPDPQDDYHWEISLARSARELGYQPQIDLVTGLTEYAASLDTDHHAQWWLPCAWES